MDDVDLIIGRMRRHGADGEWARLLPVVDSLRRGGLSYAMDWHKASRFADAADAGRRLGAPAFAEMLAEAAHIAQTCRGRELDAAATTYDRRYTEEMIVRTLRAAVAARQQELSATFPPGHGS